MAGSHDREMDMLESKLITLRDVSTAEVKQVSASRKISELKTLIKTNRESHKKQKKNTIASIMQVVTEAANHRELTQMRLGQLTEMHRQRLESLLHLGGDSAVQPVKQVVHSPADHNQIEMQNEQQQQQQVPYSLPRSTPHSSSSISSTAQPYRSPFLDSLPVPPALEQQHQRGQEQQQELEEDEQRVSEYSEEEEEGEIDNSLFHDENALGGEDTSHYIRQTGASGLLEEEEEGEEGEEEEEGNEMRFVSNLSAKFNMDDGSA